MAIIRQTSNPFSPCGRRWRRRASKTPVFRQALAPDEGSRRKAHFWATRRYRAYSAELSCARSKPAPDGANPSSGASRHLPPQRGEGCDLSLLLAKLVLELGERI